MGPDADFVVGGDVRGLDFAPRLASLKKPILIIGGRADGIASPRWLVRFRDAAPRAHVEILERSGHFPFIEQTADYLKLLRDFLR
jgi:proline iminopeptidase